jgi:NAD(P)-dependent dehydrogenase (short-subunit alcohol dehydrogenase family)
MRRWTVEWPWWLGPARESGQRRPRRSPPRELPWCWAPATSTPSKRSHSGSRAVNNATDGPRPAPLADIDPDEFDRGIATNIRGTFLGMKFQIGAMLDSGGGAIVNMASQAGIIGTANLAAYVAGKAGIIGLTKVAALDYADRGIRVNVVAPGPIRTHRIEAAGAEAQRLAGLSTPMRRMGSVSEVASVVLWLCSDQSSFVTGAVVPIDGGQSAGNKPPQMYVQGKPMSAQN